MDLYRSGLSLPDAPIPMQSRPSSLHSSPGLFPANQRVPLPMPPNLAPPLITQPHQMPQTMQFNPGWPEHWSANSPTNLPLSAIHYPYPSAATFASPNSVSRNIFAGMESYNGLSPKVSPRTYTSNTTSVRAKSTKDVDRIDRPSSRERERAGPPPSDSTPSRKDGTTIVEVCKIVEVLREVPIDRIVEVPVDKLISTEIAVPIDRVVVKEINVPYEIEKIIYKDRVVEVERVVQKEVQKIVEVPVERVVVKEVAVPIEIEIQNYHEKEVIKEVPVERIVFQEVVVEVEKPVIKEVLVPTEKLVFKEIPVEVEKVVVKEVPVPIETPYEVVVYREIPVEKIIEKEVPVPIDRICKEVCEVPVDRIVQRFVEVPVEKIVLRDVEVPTEKLVTQSVEVPVEKVVVKEIPVYIEKVVTKEIEKFVATPGKSQNVELLDLRQENERLQGEQNTIRLLRLKYEGQPNLTGLRVSDTATKLQWTAVDGADTYVVQASGAGVSGSEPNESDYKSFFAGPSLECIATDLEAEAKYYFRVRAESKEDHGPWTRPLCICLVANSRVAESVVVPVTPRNLNPGLSASTSRGSLERSRELSGSPRHRNVSNSAEELSRLSPPRRNISNSAEELSRVSPRTPRERASAAVNEVSPSPSDAQWRRVSHGLC